MTPRVKGLLVLLGLGALVFGWQYFRPAGSASTAPARDPEARIEEGSSRPNTRGGRRGREEEPVREVAELRIADLEVEGGEYHAGRNPFDFYSPPPPPPPPGPTPEELAAARAAAEDARRAAQQAAAARTAEPPAPEPPDIDFAYLGSFGPPDRRIAVFSDGENLFNLLVGDILRRDFRLVRIGFESAELEYVDFPELPPARVPVGAEGI